MNKKKMMMFEIMSGNSGSGGGADVSGVTATAPDVDEGKIFVDNTGSQVVGTSTYKADYIALRTDIDNLNDTLEPVLLGDGSDTNVYANVSNVTATAGDVATGKVFVNNSGQEVTGTAVDSTADLIAMVQRSGASRITIPNGTTHIGASVFSGWENLKGVTIPDTVTRILDYAFNMCRTLELSSLPNSITTIGNGAFANCAKITLTSLPNSITNIGNNAFSQCNLLALTSLPNGITEIKYQAFTNCPNLALTSLPSGITKIDIGAFSGCSNITIDTIPASVKTINNHAFQSCAGMTEVTFLGTPTTLSSIAFSSCTNITTIRVPWSSGAISGAPWGATNATIVYDYTPS